MAKKKHLPQEGDFVQVHHYPDLHGQVVELRGPLGPKGMQVYRVRIERDPEPMFIEFTEDQLEVVSAKG